MLHIYSVKYSSSNFIMLPFQKGTLILEHYINHSYLALHAPPFPSA